MSQGRACAIRARNTRACAIMVLKRKQDKKTKEYINKDIVELLSHSVCVLLCFVTVTREANEFNS